MPESAALKPLETIRMPDGRRMLVRDLKVRVKGTTITVPQGFTSDFSSIPWFMSWLVHWSRVDIAGVVHDWLYQHGQRSRRWDDDAWLVLAESGHHHANRVQSRICWIGIRLFGWIWFNR